MSDSGVTASSLPAYSPKKIYESFKDFESDTQFEVTTVCPSLPYGDSRAIGSYTDLTLQTPITGGSFNAGSLPSSVPENGPEPRFLPVNPPTHPRMRALLLPSLLTSSHSRPVTFPSFDASHRDIHSFKPEPQ